MRRLAIAMALCIALAAPSVLPQDAETPPVQMISQNGIAIFGYDVVSYFRSGDARLGIPIFTVEYGGHIWQFESEFNMKVFQEDPERHLPAYAGFSATGIAEGYAAAGDPEVWSIKDGRLFFFFTPSLRNRWLQDPKGMIRRADRNWTMLMTR